jgi:hypothetical protein
MAPWSVAHPITFPATHAVSGGDPLGGVNRPAGEDFVTVTDINGVEQFKTVTDINGAEQRITVAVGTS